MKKITHKMVDDFVENLLEPQQGDDTASSLFDKLMARKNGTPEGLQQQGLPQQGLQQGIQQGLPQEGLPEGLPEGLGDGVN